MDSNVFPADLPAQAVQGFLSIQGSRVELRIVKGRTATGRTFTWEPFRLPDLESAGLRQNVIVKMADSWYALAQVDLESLADGDYPFLAEIGVHVQGSLWGGGIPERALQGVFTAQKTDHARNGYFEVKMIKNHPYAYYRFRDAAGKLKSKYVGKAAKMQRQMPVPGGD